MMFDHMELSRGRTKEMGNFAIEPETLGDEETMLRMLRFRKSKRFNRKIIPKSL